MAVDDSLGIFIKSLQLRCQLAAGDCHDLKNIPFSIRTLESNTYLVEEQDKPSDCAILLSGFAYRSKLSADGFRQILAINVPGDALDLQNLYFDTSDHSIQMLSRGKVAFVARHFMRNLITSGNALGHALMIACSADASILREWLLNIGRRNAKTRVAHLLCELTVRLEVLGLIDRCHYELPVTQEQIADALGLTPIHVNRMLRVLQSDGVISRTRRSISFINWKQLCRIGEFNPQYLHLDIQQLL